MVKPLIIIPTLEPNQKLLKLLADIREFDQDLPILIIDDGSGDKYQNIFYQAENKFKTKVIHHPENKGKGVALKTAMATILADYPETDFMVTIDSDGQHSYTDMMKTVELASLHPDELVLELDNLIETYL
ncbi:glycosyltransferase [Aerococcus urinaeequi]|uniref:glycosyltransferase n=1 Tax=Aerococcus urinaeequi TaxID=51665 RepID=UPI002890872A|nr:glycosyltransferase [Aerococcus urinaeequi]MDT2761811.1 glycosyltransferase [Aerococcus urinaeequi]